MNRNNQKPMALCRSQLKRRQPLDHLTIRLRFQRPDGLVDLARDDAHRLGVRDGDEVTVRTNGTSAKLRARVRRNVRSGVVLVPEGSADDLVPGTVEVTPA